MTKFHLAAVTSLGLLLAASSASAAPCTASYQRVAHGTYDQILIRMTNNGTEAFAGSTRISAAQLNVQASGGTLLYTPVSNNGLFTLPVASGEEGMAATLGTTKARDEVFSLDASGNRTAFLSPGFTSSKFTYFGYDSVAPVGVAANVSPATLLSLAVTPGATVSVTGLAGNEYYLSGSPSKSDVGPRVVAMQPFNALAIAPLPVPEPATLAALTGLSFVMARRPKRA